MLEVLCESLAKKFNTFLRVPVQSQVAGTGTAASELEGPAGITGAAAASIAGIASSELDTCPCSTACPEPLPPLPSDAEADATPADTSKGIYADLA